MEKFLNHLSKFTVSTIIVVVIVTRPFQLELLDTLMIETDGVIKDLTLEYQSVELVTISLGKKKFVGNTGFGLFDGNNWRENWVRSIGEFLDGGVVGRGRGFGRGSSRRIGNKRLSSLKNSLRKRMRRNGGLLALRRVCNQMFRKFLRVLERKWGLTRGVSIFIVGDLVVGLAGPSVYLTQYTWNR